MTSEPASAPPPGGRSVAAVRGKTMALPGKPLVVEVRYRSQGLDTWRYDFGGGATQSRRSGAGLRAEDGDELRRHRLPGQHALADLEAPVRPRLAPPLGLREPRLRLRHRDGDAGEAAARSARRPDQLLRAGLALFLLLRDAPDHDAPAGSSCIPSTTSSSRPRSSRSTCCWRTSWTTSTSTSPS